MTDNTIQIVLAQINLIVGDIDGNAQRIMRAILEAQHTYHANLVVFPELALTGYPPEDLLFRSALFTQIDRALNALCQQSQGVDVIVGHPRLLDGKCYNSCSLIRNGHIAATYHKQRLPNYGVFDERRYFVPGHETTLFDLHGVPVALSICEDIWRKAPCLSASKAGAKLLININASPYHANKAADRETLIKTRAREANLDIIYTNLVGGQDELVFDGHSMVANHAGEIVFRAPQFVEGLYPITYPTAVNTAFSVPCGADYGLLDETETIYQALCLGVKDYVHKNGFEGVVLGLSGGIDSALTLCIAADALAADNVEALMMPSPYTSQISIEDAHRLAKNLNVALDVIPITQAFDTFKHLLGERYNDGTVAENIQSRCRAIILMARSNSTGKLVLTTGNKSEMAIGYATLYGDMAGGFAPLKDILKLTVFELANWRNRRRQVIPQRIIDRPPSAELKANQRDEDSLPPYDVLDPILERYIEHDQSVSDIIASGFDAAIVRQVVSLVNHAEYKRRQAPPGIKISQRAFGRDRRYPITSGYPE